MASSAEDEMAKTSKELRDQVALATDLLAERRWTKAGEALSVIHVNDKVIEEKERELVDCIAQNYSKLKGVEQELAGLQLDLKLTSGPKKSALELLRRKIEMQNENVVLARGKFQAARKIAESAEEVLRREEAKKDKLCQELNLLVQQSAHAQLERLEQLTQRMESLNRGFLQSSTGSQRAPEEPSARQNDASQDELSSEPHPQGTLQDQQAPQAAGAPSQAAAGKAGGEAVGAHVNATTAAMRSPPRPAEGQAESDKQAAAARSRHIPVPKAKRNVPAQTKCISGSAPAPDRRKPAATNKPFTGF